MKFDNVLYNTKVMLDLAFKNSVDKGDTVEKRKAELGLIKKS